MSARGDTAAEPTRVIVAGAAGQLGNLACEWIRDADRADPSAAPDVSATASTAGERPSGDALPPVEALELVGELRRGDAAEALFAQHSGAVLLDLTVAAESVPLVQLAVARGLHPVIGTSGWTVAQLDELEQRCADASLGALWIPNFSIGAVLQMRFAEQAARWFDAATIEELHHPAKRDAPSGTARATAQRMQAASGSNHEIPIVSERREGVLAEQHVQLSKGHETLALRHVVSDRRAYAGGLLLALRRVRGLSGLVRGLDSLL